MNMKSMNALPILVSMMASVLMNSILTFAYALLDFLVAHASWKQAYVSNFDFAKPVRYANRIIT